MSDRHFHTRAVPRAERLAVALGWGSAIGGLALAVAFRHPELLGRDFTFQWRAARAILAGLDPYKVVVPTGPFPYSSYLYYPLPAVFLTVPIAWLPVEVATALAVAVCASVLAFAMARDDYARLPLLLSAPCISAAVSGQPVPLLLAAGLVVPWLQVFAFAKPTIGAAVWTTKPSRWPIIVGIGLSLVALLVLPAWPFEWIDAARQKPGAHLTPFTIPGGVLMLLALVRWRRADARLLLAMSMVPQTMTWYDPMPLMLIARSFRESLVVALISQVGFVAALWYERTLPPDVGVDGVPFGSTAPFALWCLYVPALALVLRRPNQGEGRVWE